MKKITVAFDCDWTLIKNYPPIAIEPNERIVELLKILSSFKNVKIIVWSWQGKKWADSVVKQLWLEEYVSKIASKNYQGKDENWKHIFKPDFVADLAVDDIHSCDLWLINLIVKEK